MERSSDIFSCDNLFIQNELITVEQTLIKRILSSFVLITFFIFTDLYSDFSNLKDIDKLKHLKSQSRYKI